MKKSVLILSMILAAGSVSIANAVVDPGRNSAVLKSGSTVKVFYKGDDLTDVKVTILDENDQLVFTEKIKKTNGFTRPYNFSNLPSGNYKIQLVDDSGIQVEHINYAPRPEKRQKTSYVARVGGTTDKFILAVPNKGGDKISVTILTDEDAVLYKGDEAIEGDFAKVYTLKHYVGPLRFVVTDSQGVTDTWITESL